MDKLGVLLGRRKGAATSIFYTVNSGSYYSHEKAPHFPTSLQGPSCYGPCLLPQLQCSACVPSCSHIKPLALTQINHAPQPVTSGLLLCLLSREYTASSGFLNIREMPPAVTSQTSPALPCAQFTWCFPIQYLSDQQESLLGSVLQEVEVCTYCEELLTCRLRA